MGTGAIGVKIPAGTSVLLERRRRESGPQAGRLCRSLERLQRHQGDAKIDSHYRYIPNRHINRSGRLSPQGTLELLEPTIIVPNIPVSF
jgi:hypothetical protein